MIQPEMSPKPSGPRPQLGGQHLSANDIDLPPLQTPAAEATLDTEGSSVIPAGQQKAPQQTSPLWMAAGLIAALAVGAWLWQRNQPAETAHPNWQHVAAAADASSAQGTNVVIQRDLAGAARQSASVELSLTDADAVTTQAVREALLKNDLATANAALNAAQRLGTTALALSEQRQAAPALGPEARIVTAIRDGSAQFFHLRLFDCCDEDGDVVDVALDGRHYATVPLTHEGKIISLPLTPGTTVVTLRGVRDGGGCITVSFQTSQGQYFSQPLDVGEECHMGVVVK